VGTAGCASASTGAARRRQPSGSGARRRRRLGRSCLSVDRCSGRVNGPAAIPAACSARPVPDHAALRRVGDEFEVRTAQATYRDRQVVVASQHSSCYGAVINVRYQVHAPHCGLSDVGQPCQPYQPPPAPRRRPSNGVRYAEVRCHSNASLLECDGSPRTACRRIPVEHCWNETPGLCALARTLRRAPARAVEPGTSSGDTGSGCMPGRTHVAAGRAQQGQRGFVGS
jgi:hypothetical protein